MKRIFAVLAVLLFAFALAACGKESPAESNRQLQPAHSQTDSRSEGLNGQKVLVAYFSATGHTEKVAYSLQEAYGADLFRITPEVPYSAEDLDYHDENCRANTEQKDPAARPAIMGKDEKLGKYDVVFLGYPIWWGKAPKVIYTFLESFDFGNAVIVPFCTSGSSGISGSLEELRVLEPQARWTEGRRFDAAPDREEAIRWAREQGVDIGL